MDGWTDGRTDGRTDGWMNDNLYKSSGVSVAFKRPNLLVMPDYG